MSLRIFPDGIYGDATEAAYNELMRAKAKFPELLNSAHEGYAVLKEEVDELWDDVKANKKPESVVEAIQVAAMAIRYAAELGKYPYTKK